MACCSVAQYLNDLGAWRQRLGAESVVFKEVGGLYEAYALEDVSGAHEGADLKGISRVLSTRLAPRGMAKDGRRKIMTGFKSALSDEYAGRLADTGRPVVLVSSGGEARVFGSHAET